MKKKIYSILIATLILFGCIFTTACGDKYKNLQFDIWYAYSEDAKEWFNANDGFALNYSKMNYEGIEGENPSLVFDSNGQAPLFVKIGIKNVKAKHIDSITVSFASLTGVNFSSTRVKANQVFQVPITGNVNTILKLYENNSGRKKELPFVISRELESIVANDDLKPAMAVNGSLNLLGLNNLQYLPLNLTNQIGVTYSVDGIGAYNSAGEYISKYDADTAKNYVEIQDGILSLKDDFFGEHSYVLKIKATSIYHDGSREGEEPIYDVFDVYLVEGRISAPNIKFNDVGGDIVKQQVNIYENGGDYSTSTIFVDTTDLEHKSLYQSGLNTTDGKVEYKVAVYVLNGNNAYEKYVFNDEAYQSGINGIIIHNNETDESLGENQFKFSILNRKVERNKIKVVYEIQEFDFSSSKAVKAETALDVVKGVMPTCITIDDTKDLYDDGDPSTVEMQAVVYETSSVAYRGLALKVSANPNNDNQKEIVFEDPNGNLIIVDDKGNGASTIKTNNTIFIKFKPGVVDDQPLILKTAITPEYYNGKYIKVDDYEYISVKINLTKVVTANSLHFVDAMGEDVSSIKINAEGTSSTYLKAYYDGVTLDASTISLTSSNGDLFANGADKINLSDASITKTTSSDAHGKFDFFTIPVETNRTGLVSRITAIAADGKIGVSDYIDVSSVYLLNEDDFNVDGTSANVKEFDSSVVNNGAFNFAVPKGEFAEFQIFDGENKTNTISRIEITTEDVAGFNKTATNYNVISNSVFVASARSVGTQILNVQVYYYELVDNKIELKTSEIVVQIAVFDAIKNISTKLTKDSIGYINKYFQDAASTEIEFNSYTSNYGTPANQVKFNGGAGTIPVDNASQLKVTIRDFIVLNNNGNVSIKAQNTIDLMDPDEWVLNIVSGKISIELLGQLGGLEQISLTISALNFGQPTDVSSTVVINLAKIQTASSIEISGKNIVQTSDISNELQMSFIDVAEDGFDETSFDVNVRFASQANAGELRFDKPEEALTHMLYEYVFDANNEIVEIKRVRDDLLNVSYEDGVVKVRAYKNNDGGVFKLVLATKDSYNKATDPNTIIVMEEDFNTSYSIDVRVEDGIGTAFRIRSIEDLKNVKFNLDKKFELAANLDLRDVSDFEPIGPFAGQFSGQTSTPILGESVIANHSITLNATKSVQAIGNYGDLVGLFSVISDSGKVSNLTLNVCFDGRFTSSDEDGLKIGALAGVNQGTITNIKVNINSETRVVFDVSESSEMLAFGGVVGLNEGEISATRVICLDQIKTSSTNQHIVNIGLISGYNKGIISGSYVGKASLNNFVYDVVADMQINSGNYKVGAVAGGNEGNGTSTGIIQNLLVGGRINTVSATVANIGGIVGYSNSGLVTTVTAMALDITFNSDTVYIGGIVGKAERTIIHYAKYVTVNLDFGDFKVAGQLKNTTGTIGGVLGTAGDDVTITYSSVESFVQTITNEIYGTTGQTFYVLDGTTVGSLVGSGSATISDSFVSANIKAPTVNLQGNYHVGIVNEADSAYQQLTTDGDWTENENYNGGNPYLLRNWDEEDVDVSVADGGAGPALMIIEPTSIRESACETYIVDHKSVHVVGFDYKDYDVSATVLANYYNGAGDEKNAYNIISSGAGANDGLIDVTLVPIDAQGGYVYQILGPGRNFAYINDSKQIVFTGASGQLPIIVEIKSAFKPEVKVYVAFYSQALFTSLELNSNSIFNVAETDYKYQTNVYSGQENQVITLQAENRIAGNNNKSILDVYGLAQYLYVDYEVNKASSKLAINTSNYSNMTLKIEDGAVIDDNYSEIVTFNLYLKAEYFETYLDSFIDDIKVGSVNLNVRLYNSAKTINVDGDDLDVTTHDDFSFNVYLTTDFVNEGEYTSTEIVESDYVNADGDICFTADGHDSFKIKLDVYEGENIVRDLIDKNKIAYQEKFGVELKHFAQLFDIQIISSLYKEDITNNVIGYKYNVLLELFNEHDYRYIEENIKFNILVYAESNHEVNNENSPMEVNLKPTVLSTARIENYTVKELKFDTDYTTLVTNDYTQTSIVEPGSFGNVMMIYLEPTYSNVKSATIKTSQLYVPSLGRNVQMKFTQVVYDERLGTGAFTTLFDGHTTQQGDTLELKRLSRIDENAERYYTGVIYVFIQLEKFGGLEATMTAELSVETEGKTVTRSRELLTSYLPEVRMQYDAEKAIKDGYLIQKGTAQNEIKIKVFGYQFNANPDIKIRWNIVDGSQYKYVDDDRREIYLETNGTTGWQIGEDKFLIGDYVTRYLLNDYDEVIYNPLDGSYTISLKLNVAEDIPTSFTVGAELSLTTKDGQLKTSNENENKLIFYPTNYILKSVYVNNLVDGKKNIKINKTSQIELRFTTDSQSNDLTETIYQDLLTYIKEDENPSEKFGSLFSYFKNGGTVYFNEADLHPEFEFNFVNEELISITGISTFANTIQFMTWFEYADTDKDGVYSVVFGEKDNLNRTPLSTSFGLDISPIALDKEIQVYSADEIYNSASGTWDLIEGAKYVLMNDITLENVVPITTPIAQLDGNNRVIKIKSFAVNAENSQYGLFAEIGKYSIEEAETGKTIEKQTLLKNVIVDYSDFNGTIALNNLTNKDVIFGGLVAVNNGGLIYNCDVMNLGTSKTTIDVIVAGDSNVAFGGLVGVNDGIITNSRVGRDSYTRVTATKTTESMVKVHGNGLSFSIFNRESANDQVNQFEIVSGGFVGRNTGMVSNCYVENTNLYNYSTNESLNYTSGFVGENSGTISYSFAKADEGTISVYKPMSTGYVIENLGNGVVSGFVGYNTGEISDSYSNIELKTKSSYIAGFVYHNAGRISECYAACTMNSGVVNNIAEQPFVGVDNAGNLLSNGIMDNTYYLMRSETDNPYKDGDKDIAQALNEENFQIGEYLVGFAFVLSNSKVEREQGVWSYYTLDNQKRVLPELMSANNVAHSYRYVLDTASEDKILTNTISFEEGSANNPYTISSVEDYNLILTDDFVGHVRFINNIDFNDDKTAIKTRNYTLGSSIITSRTSIEGNGMTISGIYLDAGTAVVDKIGMFAEVKNSYIKNLNLEFAIPSTEGQFSTTTATYSGGLAGLVQDSALMNISLYGPNTTLTGNNFVGGLAGLIKGNSLIYGIESNINVKANATEGLLYYSEEDYSALNIDAITYAQYIKKLSYAGGIAGVMDLTKRSNVEYNVQFIDVHGDEMSSKTFEGKSEANILAEYAGGVAGYASMQTDAFKLRYFVGDDELIRGDTAVGGLFAVGMGGITASQVTAKDEDQFGFDTKFGEYVTKLSTDPTATISEEVGNKNLLESFNYAGGLVGLGLNTNIKASYSKAGIKSGIEVGGLIGLSVASGVSYSYAVPYVNINENMKNVGGLIGSAYNVSTLVIDRNSKIKPYENLLKLKGVGQLATDIQFTFSTLIVDNSKLNSILAINNLRDVQDKIVLDYICADYKDGSKTYLQSNSSPNLTYVYAGKINYLTDDTNDIVTNSTKDSKSSQVELTTLYDVGEPAQTLLFQEIFSSWSIVKYWSLKEEKYFPLLNNEVVDNYIDIEDQWDLEHIRNNPDGKFRVVRGFEINPREANWIIGGQFRGVLIGEITNKTERPVISIMGLNPTENDSTGFFKETFGATISNIEFEWQATSRSSIDLSGVDSVKMVSGLTCKDTNSLISNVQVRTTCADDGSNGYIINTAKTISGFGGLVGESTNTNLLGCEFIGKMEAVINNASNEAYVGGLVAKTETKTATSDSFATDEDLVQRTSVLSGNKIGTKNRGGEGTGNKNYPQTLFDITISEAHDGSVYIGGAIGKATNSGIASIDVGGTSYVEDYSHISIGVKFGGHENNVYIGGVVGHATDGLMSTCQALTNITITGSVTCNSVKVGGLAGDYSVTAESSTSGISNCNVSSNIFAWIEINSVPKTYEYFSANNGTSVYMSTGVATLSEASISQCYFSGKVDTEHASIVNLYAGGAVAYSSNVKLSEVVTDSAIIAGTEATTQLYVGGLIGKTENDLQISYSTAWGRIVPITADEGGVQIYVGGLVGQINLGNEKSAQVNNSYSLVSIIADSISNSAIENLNIGALVGQIPSGSTEDTIDFDAVYYSSDYAMFADENYLDDNSSLGSNLSAQTMLLTDRWQTELKTEGVANDIWKSLVINGKTRVPYPTSLEETLISHAVLRKETGKTQYDYVSGTAMRPEQIIADGDTYVFKSDDIYTYYLLVEGTKVLPEFTNALYGVLIGQQLDYGSTFTASTLSTSQGSDGNNVHGAIPMVGKHSAISNLHVEISASIVGADTFGIIAGENNGVIFNCSVQGNGIEITGETIGTSGGLIAGRNSGLISYSYSSAEIKSTSVSLGGIVHTNGGKLLSNYFTGYIETNGSINVAGVIVACDDGNFAYNNYMAGVIKGGNGDNNFIANTADFAGANNFIDHYSDIEYSRKTGTDVVTGIKSVDTLELMTGKGGTSPDVWELDGEWHFAATTTGVNKDADGFGKNYNYPIYRFNKFIQPGDTLEKNDHYNQLPTGTGDVSGDLSARFTNLNYSTIDDDGVTYANAFKIPHLGVLKSIATISEADRNFVVIYDIDGMEDAWTTELAFSGVFVTNKYYAATSDLCKIENISGSGLFNTISNAYIGNIVFGNFKNLADSGPIANTATGDTTINNVSYKEETTITGATDDLGGLFGNIDNTNVSIVKFDSTNLTLSGNATQVGLIAGTSTGATISLADGKAAANPNGNVFVVSYVDLPNAICGGLVGVMSGGTIKEQENPTVQYKNQIEFKSISNIKTFGGLVGQVTNESTISAEITLKSTGELSVNVVSGKTAMVGLVAGNISAELTISSLTFDTISKINITCAEETYFDENCTDTGVGTFVGVQNGDLEISSITNATAVQIELNVIGIPNVGGISGLYQGGNVSIPNNMLDLTISGTTNVGGVFGYVKGAIGSSFSVFGSKIATVKVQGFDSVEKVQNCGGLFGKLAGSISTALTNKNPISIEKNGVAYNIGGIAGLWASSSGASSLKNEESITMMGVDTTGYSKIQSADEAVENIYCQVVNVGGVIGYVKDATFNGLTNNNQVQGYQNVGGLIGYGEEIIITGNVPVSGDLSGLTATTGDVYGVVNVGGIIGLAKEATIQQFYSSKNVYGNVNVGGIVGLAESSTITTNIIQGSYDSENKIYTGLVKGIYYNYHYKDVNDQNQINSFIPTSVGGLIGTSSQSTIKNNRLDTVYVASADEGMNNVVISTISNYMANIVLGEANVNTISNFNDPNAILNLTNAKVDFNNISSGYGGFVGTIDDASFSGLSDNAMKNIDINAQLGVNVGTYYGVVKNTKTDDITITVPTIEGTATVDGAYMVGGIVGFFDGEMPALNNSTLTKTGESSVTISIQSRITGFYVGGLVGKTNDNEISGLSIASGKDVNMKIHTDNCYYAGGLIGRAEVSRNKAEIKESSVGAWNANTMEEKTDEIVVGNSEHNFGGLIGMLKVAENGGDTGFEVTVTGNHNFPFTINTIENSNYLDGQTVYNNDEVDGEVNLYAQAYYINLDKFTISPSKSVPIKNPLDSNTLGWAPDYTMFRAMQRCKPQTGLWDSIAVIYDAVNIKGVSYGGGKITHTIYEEEEGSPNVYTVDGIYFILRDSQGFMSGYDENRFKAILESKGYNAYTKYTDENTVEYPDYWERYLETYKYRGADYYFFKEVVYSTTAQSGSIFEVNGCGNSIFNGLVKDTEATKKQKFWAWFKTLWNIPGFKDAKNFWDGAARRLFWPYNLAKNIQNLLQVYKYERFERTDQAEWYFINNERLSYGFLSNLYSREISYTSSNGKLVEVSNMDDTITYRGFEYLSYSIDKPTQYLINRYLLIGLTNDSAKADNTEIIYTDPGDNPNIADDDMPYYMLKVDETATPTICPIYEPMIILGTSTDGWKVVEYEGTTYLRVDYFLNYQGQYWMHSLAATEEKFAISNSFFTAPSSGGREISNSYVQTSNGTYVHGSWDGTNYKFVQNYGNYITDNNKTSATVDYGNSLTYTLENNLTHKQTLHFAPIDEQPEGNFEPVLPYVNGYNIIQGAYYTENGDSSLFVDRNKNGQKDAGEELVRYATFKPYNGTPTQEDIGIKYVQGYYNETYDTFEEDSEGRYMFNGSEFVEIVDPSYGGQRYSAVQKTQVKDQWYEIKTDTAFKTSLATGETVNSDDHPAVDGDDDILVAVYPSAFVNPYDDTIDGSQDTVWYKVSENGVDHEVEYFLWIGGFKVRNDGDGVYNVYIPTSHTGLRYEGGHVKKDGQINFTVEDEDGTPQTIDYDAIFIYDNGKFYEISTKYSIEGDEDQTDGRLYRRYPDYSNKPSTEQSNVGKYLIDEDYQFYTRYIHDKKWKFGNYSLIPKQNNDGSPNGATTNFIEVVKVCFGGYDSDSASKSIYYESNGQTLKSTTTAGWIRCSS